MTAPSRHPLALIILDGFALREEVEGNAVAQASKPNFDRYWNTWARTTLTACGEAVGLPEGQMGNSEVGHLNIGAGRVVYQDLTRISKSIKDGEFLENQALLDAVLHAKSAGKKLHICGLLSDGGVHSHIEHFMAMLQLAGQQGLQDVYVHAFLDGRDVAPDSGKAYTADILAAMTLTGVGQLATVMGRYYAMDRDNRWERVQKAYDAMVHGIGEVSQNAIEAIESSYTQKVFDEFMTPTVIIDEHHHPIGAVEEGDAVVFMNFRPDRAIQIATALTSVEFNRFDRGSSAPEHIHFVCMTTYSDAVQGIVAFPPKDITHTLGDVISAAGMNQLRIAETEKYPHVTFFFNGGRDQKLPGETRILINSPNVATYDLQPEMSAREVTDAVVAEIEADRHDLIILNFANCDMVGHSGILEPTIKAVEVTDECLGRVVEVIVAKQGIAMITADHGNADMVTTASGQPFTAHTTNPVPLIVTANGIDLRSDGKLGDLAPTALQLMGMAQPAEMTGSSLITEKQGNEIVEGIE